MNVSSFLKALKDYQSHNEIKLPTDMSERELVPSCENTAHQKVIDRSVSHTGLAKEFRAFIDGIDDLKKNLNYTRSNSDWEDFYVYPRLESAKRYADEEGISLTSVCNLNKMATTHLVDSLIGLLGISEVRSTVRFLSGTTGVGKTTYLKHFTKTQKDHAALKSTIISRVKFRDIQHNLAPRKDVREIFQQEIVDCLFRDVFDTCKRLQQQATPSQIIKMQSPIDDFMIEIAEEEGWSETKLFSLEQKYSQSTESIHDEITTKKKAGLLSRVSEAGFSFIIILDGFDAMNPEDIKLFGSGREADFFICISKILLNQIDRDHSTFSILRDLNKVFLVAARPITITQLKEAIEAETDSDHYIYPDNVHVVGTDIYPLLEQRMKIKFRRMASKKKIDMISMFVERGIRYIVRTLNDAHENMIEGRFMQLFNHNIREKISFIADSIDLILFKVEQKFEEDKKAGIFPPKQVVDFDVLEKYFDEDFERLDIDLYEIQRLLILNKDGYFKNFFFVSADNELTTESERGQFDNLFNYLSSDVFSDEEDYQWWNDPILEKIWILYRINKTQSVPVRVLRNWFRTDFRRAECRDESLRVLIRGGIIIAYYVSDEVYVKLSEKGKFLFSDLLKLNIYIEHVLMNCKVPYFISRLISAPEVKKHGDGRRDHRSWGRASISNIAIFLSYLREVTSHSIKDGNDDLRKELINLVDDDILGAIYPSFRGIISEGLKTEGRDYEKELQRDMIKIGVSFP